MNFSYQDALAYYGIDGAHPGSLALTKKLLQQEKIVPITKLLDAGCGTGQTSFYIASTYPCKVYSIDSHPEMIKKAHKRFKSQNLPIKLYHASMENMPFKTGTFDIILAESSTAFTNIDKSIPEYYRILKKGGVLLTIDMTAEADLNQSAKQEIRLVYGVNAVLTEDEWTHCFNRAGFNKVNILKSSTIDEEIANYTLSQENQQVSMNPLPFNPSADSIMKKHQEISMKYGNSLGYRVFRITGK